MLLRKRPWVFVFLCCVCVCCGAHLFDFANTVPSVDASAAVLV